MKTNGKVFETRCAASSTVYASSDVVWDMCGQRGVAHGPGPVPPAACAQLLEAATHFSMIF